MLSYDDASLSHNQPPAFSECVVCKDLVDSDNLIWHKVKTSGYDRNGDYVALEVELLVPICIDCADLFHDVKPSKPQRSS